MVADKKLHESRTLGIAINCPPADVYAFVVNPANLPRWAKGLGGAVRKTDAGWVIETPDGEVAFRFAAQNDFGVLDHTVYPASGVEIYVPMRVVPNGEGSEITLTLFRQPGMTEVSFAADIELVTSDLETLKAVLEEGQH